MRLPKTFTFLAYVDKRDLYCTSVILVMGFVDRSLFFSTFVLGGGGGGGSVAIVRIGICTSDIVIGAGIVYCTRNRS